MGMTIAEILSRLNIQGGTQVGGSSTYASFLPVLNSSGQLDPSFFTSTNTVWEIPTDASTRTSLAAAKVGDTVVENNVAYILRSLPAATSGNWIVTGSVYSNVGANVSFDPGSTNLASTTLQNALTELWTDAVLINANRTLTGTLTFSTSGAPFAVTGSSIGALVTGLNADLLDGQHGAYYLNAANLTGTLAAGRLTGTYPISITGTSALASLASLASVAAIANALDETKYTVQHAVAATSAISATSATNATYLNDGGGNYRSGSYYLNAGNLNAGTIPSAVFVDTSHGLRGSVIGSSPMHAVATTSAAGFMSSTDKTKLNGIQDGAQVNQNAFTSVAVAGQTTLTGQIPEDTLTLAAGSGVTITTATGNVVTIGFNTSGISHHGLADLTGYDDHTQYVSNTIARTITAQHTLNVTGAPFILGGGAQGQLVTGFNADLLDGQHGAYYRNAANLTGTLSTGVLPSSVITTGNIGSYTIPTSGGVFTGAVTVPTLYDYALQNGSLPSTYQVIGADADGQLVQNVTTTHLTEGANLYWTNSRFTAALAAANATLYSFLIGALQSASGNTITWSGNGTAHTVTPVLAINSDQVTEGSTNKYSTWANIAAAISANTAELIAAIGTTAATASTLAERDGSGNLTAVKMFDTQASSPNNQLANYAYVQNALSTYTPSLAVSDITVYTGSRSSYPKAEPGELIKDSGVYYISLGNNTWQTVSDTAITNLVDSPLIQNGAVTGKQLGYILKAACLTDSQLNGSIFCPSLRVSEPLVYDMSNSPGARATTYANGNWKKYTLRSVKARGRVGKNYMLLLNAQGWIYNKHVWNLRYKTYNSGSYTTTVLPIGPNASNSVGIHDTTATLFSEINNFIPIIVAGQSEIELEFYSTDGNISAPTNNVFPGLAPLTVNGVKPAFNGGFVNIQGAGVWSLNANEPYNPYTPDLLPLLSEGVIVSGGINYQPANALSDYRVYDGEDLTDNQRVITGFTAGADSNGFTTYTVSSSGTVFEDSSIRSTPTVLNKLVGFAGYLRNETIISSGPNITGAVADSSWNTLTIAAANAKLAYPIDLTTYLLSQSLSLSGISITTPSMGGTLGDIASAIAAATNTSDGSPAGLSLTYSPSTDRFSINFGAQSSVPIWEMDTTGKLLNSLRIATTGATTFSGISLPRASGLRLNSGNPISGLNLATGVQITAPDGSGNAAFVIDGTSYSYNLTNTLVDIQSSIAVNGYDLQYNAAANDLLIRRLPGVFSGSQELIQPRVYDTTGTLMTALGLEKESHGNRDFPIEAVHNLQYVADGIIVVGNFKTFNGAVSPGIAKISFTGQIDYEFNPGVGFDTPVYAVTPIAGSTTDLLIAPITPGSYKGFNRKSIFRLDNTGTENTATQVFECPVSQDNQPRVLDIISFTDGYFAVLTPRKLQLYSSAGALVHTYGGTKSFHGAVYYKKDSSNIEYFLLASTAYSQVNTTQSFISGGTFTGNPAGLKLLQYNPGTHTISICDSTSSLPWCQISTLLSDNVTYGPGAGAGAAASCAYPIVYEDGASSFAVAGNSGLFWGSGQVSGGTSNTSWDNQPNGNLLTYSQTFDNAAWTLVSSGSSATLVNDTTYYALTTTVAANTDYLYQNFDATNYHIYQYATPAANSGGLSYELDVEIGTTTGATGYPFIGLEFTTSGNPSNNYTVGLTLDTNYYSTGPLFSPYVPSLPGGALGNVKVYYSGSNTYIVKITVTDSSVGSTTVTPVIYPAYTNVLGGSKVAVARGINLYRAALRYGGVVNNPTPSNPNPGNNTTVSSGSGTWGTWGEPSGTFAPIYISTTTTPVYPSSGSNSDKYRGLYKVFLEGNQCGKADGAFAVNIVMSENQAHPIPFDTDSSGNIYFGGPVSSINGNSVTPWGLYAITSTGTFIRQYQFNDKVTSCLITPEGYLVVGGAFTAYNRYPAGKIIFLTLDGNPILDIGGNTNDVIFQPTPPSAINQNKIWADNSVQPPVLYVYDTTTSTWVNALFASKQLPAPIVVTTPANTWTNPPSIGFSIDPTFNIRNSSYTGATSTDVKIMYTINTPPVSGTLVSPTWYDPAVGITLTTPGTTTNYTIYAQAALVDSSTGGSDPWMSSKIVSQVFTMTPAAIAPTVTIAGYTGYTAVTLSSSESSAVFSYFTAPPGTALTPALLTSAVWLTYSAPFNVTGSCVVFAKSNVTGEVTSAITSYSVSVSLPTVSYTNTFGSAATTGAAFTTALSTTGGTGVIYYTGATTWSSPSSPPTGYVLVNFPVNSSGVITSRTVTLDLTTSAMQAAFIGNVLTIQSAVVAVNSTGTITDYSAVTTKTINRLASVAITPGVLTKGTTTTLAVTGPTAASPNEIVYSLSIAGGSFGSPTTITPSGSSWGTLSVSSLAVGSGAGYPDFALFAYGYDSTNAKLPSPEYFGGTAAAFSFYWSIGPGTFNWTNDGAGYGYIAPTFTKAGSGTSLTYTWDGTTPTRTSPAVPIISTVPTIPLDTLALNPGTVTLKVLEFTLSGPTKYDVVTVDSSKSTYPLAGLQLYDVADAVNLTAGSTSTVTFAPDPTNKLFNITGLSNSSTITAVRFNNNGVIAKASAVDNTITGTSVKFTPTISAISSGTATMAVRFFAPNYVPSAMLMLYTFNFSLPSVLIKLNGVATTGSVTPAMEYQVALTNSVPTAEIYYTLDGTVPTQQSSLYTGKFWLRDDYSLGALNVKAFKYGWVNSNTGVATIPSGEQITSPTNLTDERI